MAIVQISKIQVRRGKENEGTGVPQLSSGEFGWAVDTQRLYIGSGSTQEGAPELENVRILTESDNILTLTEQYYYKGFDDLLNVPMVGGAFGRSIQSRLDDFVSANSFGVVGDGIVDDSDAIQAAIDALYSAGASNSVRTILYFPAGVYRLTKPIEIPPYANIIGAGIGNTVLRNAATSVFVTVGDVELNQVSLDTQSRYIRISDMTVELDGTNLEVGLELNSCAYSYFKNLQFVGNWNLTEVEFTHRAIQLNSLSTLITSKNNIFDNVLIERFYIGVYSDAAIRSNKFLNMSIKEVSNGVVFDGVPTGPILNVIENSIFDLIEQEGILILAGDYNTSRGNTFINVGNEAGDESAYPVIRFDTNTNVSVNDYFERTALTTSNKVGSPSEDTKYYPEVAGRTKLENIYSVETNVGTLLDWAKFIKLPFIDQGSIFIDYVYSIPEFNSVRSGVIEIVVSKSSVIGNSEISISDTFSTIGDTGDSSLSPGPANALEFRASLTSYQETGTDAFNTILIEAINPIILTDDSFYYTIKSKT